MRLATDDPWASYERTVVEIAWAGALTVRVRAAAEPDEASWPWPDGRTGARPDRLGSRSGAPGREVNRVRQAALEADLLTLGLPLATAVGVDPVSRRREEGVAVRGAPEAGVLALGARYGQDAVFAWTPAEWAIVACQGGRRLASPWSLEVLQPGFHFRPAADVPI